MYLHTCEETLQHQTDKKTDTLINIYQGQPNPTTLPHLILTADPHQHTVEVCIDSHSISALMPAAFLTHVKMKQQLLIQKSYNAH